MVKSNTPNNNENAKGQVKKQEVKASKKNNPFHRDSHSKEKKEAEEDCQIEWADKQPMCRFPTKCSGWKISWEKARYINCTKECMQFKTNQLKNSSIKKYIQIFV